MNAPALDRTAKLALVGAGLLLFLCGAGWAVHGSDIFLATLMAGLAGCF
jgi:hypothetical protein